ncbi:hypothetical protein KCP77_14715 [Salmonella enterica subsp. enterica]|nr:hypothetical protein KCP77_14715 [Salmonella enterica subsp. enterica]
MVPVLIPPSPRCAPTFALRAPTPRGYDASTLHTHSCFVNAAAHRPRGAGMLQKYSPHVCTGRRLILLIKRPSNLRAKRNRKPATAAQTHRNPVLLLLITG